MKSSVKAVGYWTVPELAERLRMHPNSVRLQIAKGLVPALRMPGGQYRISVRVVECLLRGEVLSATG